LPGGKQRVGKKKVQHLPSMSGERRQYEEIDKPGKGGGGIRITGREKLWKEERNGRGNKTGKAKKGGGDVILGGGENANASYLWFFGSSAPKKKSRAEKEKKNQKQGVFLIWREDEVVRGGCPIEK